MATKKIAKTAEDIDISRAEFMRRSREASQRAKKITAAVNYAEPITSQLFTIDLQTWNEFVHQCERLGKAPDEIIRERIVRFTRKSIMLEAWRGDEKGTK